MLVSWPPIRLSDSLSDPRVSVPSLTYIQSSFIHHGLDQTECEVEGLFMVVAGTESTASAIRSVLVHTMSTPAVYSQLKAEIATAVRSGAASSPVIKNEEAVRLPVLQAVIYEGLRMRPPLLGLLPKVVPAGGDTLAGHHVPAGTAVCVNASSLLRSEALFGPDTDVFRPGRFLDLQDPEARAAMQRNVELAFGSGQWQCVGKTIAFMELHKVVFEVSKLFLDLCVDLLILFWVNSEVLNPPTFHLLR